MTLTLSTRTLGLLVIALLTVTVTVPVATAWSFNPQSFWYRLAEWGYRDQLRRNCTWNWGQVGFHDGWNHEDLIILCLNQCGYSITQFLIDMGDPNPLSPT